MINLDSGPIIFYNLYSVKIEVHATPSVPRVAPQRCETAEAQSLGENPKLLCDSVAK